MRNICHKLFPVSVIIFKLLNQLIIVGNQLSDLIIGRNRKRFGVMDMFQAISAFDEHLRWIDQFFREIKMDDAAEKYRDTVKQQYILKQSRIKLLLPYCRKIAHAAD